VSDACVWVKNYPSLRGGGAVVLGIQVRGYPNPFAMCRGAPSKLPRALPQNLYVPLDRLIMPRNWNTSAHACSVTPAPAPNSGERGAPVEPELHRARD
jgi:hypothetical protein